MGTSSVRLARGRRHNARPGVVALLAGAVALLVAGCGQSGGEADGSAAAGEAATTTSVVSTTMALSSSDTTAASPASTTTEAVSDTPIEVELGPDTFSQFVQPVLENSCVSCHAPDQAGAAHMVLATAADAVENAPYLKINTGSGFMPPWPASDLSVDFVGDHSLSDLEIATIAAWADAGAEIDVDPSTPLVSPHPPSFIEQRDIVMTSASGAYTGSTARRDDYRCLIFEPGNEDLEYVVASHFEADRTDVTHHAIITMASGALREQADALDEREPGPGWTCYGGTGLTGAQGGHQVRMGGWAPGGQPARLPDGYAIPMTPGDFFIVQVHYHYEDAAPADLSRFVLELASDEEIAANAGWFKSLTGSLYLGPAEIPCYEGDTEPLCDRDTAMQRVRDLYGDRVGAFSNFFLNQCGATVADFAEMTDGDAWSTCDLRVTNPGKIVSLTGHMHELGSSIRLTLNPDTPEERILLDIPDWDFEWQLGYRPVEDIIIDSDDVIRVDCAWNRERAPYEAVGYILWADGTGDEMCYSSVTTAPLD